MTYKHKFNIKNELERYCNLHDIDTTRHIRCLSASNHNHFDKNYSMKFKNDMLYCHSCGVKYDIFDLIKLHYKLNTFKEQYIKACELFNYECEFGKSKNIKEIENIINIKQKRDINLDRFNNFCDKLIKKRSELKTIIDLIEDKNMGLYQDYRFKIDYITRFLDSNLEFNNKSLENISNFNRDYELAYKNFREYFLDIM